MKQIYTITVFMLCALLIGCNNEDSTPMEQTLKVVETTAKFDAFGGTGIIKVEAANPVSAKSDENWCKVDVTDHTINVTTEANNTLMGRTAMVTISSDTESIQLPVYQAGDSFECNLSDYAFRLQGSSCSFTLKTTRPYKVIKPEWISYKVEGNTIVFTAAASDTDRTAEVAVICGKNDVVTAQFSQIKLVATYTIAYTNNDKRLIGKGVIEKTADETYAITTTNVVLNTTIKATYVEESRKLTIVAGQMLGFVGNNTAYLCALSEGGTSLTWDNSITYVATGIFNNEGKLEFTFGDSGTWKDHQVTGFFYAVFDKPMEEGGTYQSSTWGRATDIVMTKQ